MRSIDYAAVVSHLDVPLDPLAVGAALTGATYLFDLAISAVLPQADRTIAAWALTPTGIASRDVSYQRGFPLAPGADDAPVDRGHVIAHLYGGEFGHGCPRHQQQVPE